MSKNHQPHDEIPHTTETGRFLDDETLSWKSKGLFAFIISQEWDEAIRTGLQELEARGYLVRQPLHTGTHFYKRVVAHKKYEGGKANG